MDDKDRVFANFRDSQASAGEKRERQVIPRRGSSSGRVVEVVRLASAGPPRPDRPAQRERAQGVRAVSWEDGFAARPVAPVPVPEEPAAEAATPPTVHVMPGWEPAAEEPAFAVPPIADGVPGRERAGSAAAVEEPVSATPPTVHVMPMWQLAPADDGPAPRAAPRSRGAARTRRVADPFDARDAGANCLRCGYLIEPDRDRRGLMTCAACG